MEKWNIKKNLERKQEFWIELVQSRLGGLTVGDRNYKVWIIRFGSTEIVGAFNKGPNKEMTVEGLDQCEGQNLQGGFELSRTTTRKMGFCNTKG